MTLTPTDILKIQTAIDRYEKKFPRKPSPSVAEALAWQAGKRGAEPRTDESTRIGLSEWGGWSRARESLLVWWALHR
jgi:hypothetical protein